MNIIVVDDERHAVATLCEALEEAAPSAAVSCFSAAAEALAHAQAHQVDTAFLDIDMPEMSGLALAKRLKDIHGATNIIFVTGYSSYMGAAFDMHASGYVMKPIDPARVAEELRHLRHAAQRPSEGVYVQCFGNFELFLNGKPLAFSQAKAKEMLAYLVDRKGAGVTKKELAAVLLEHTAYTRGVQSYIHRVVTSLLSTLEATGLSGLVIRDRNLYAVDTAQFRCDFYEFEQGFTPALNSYHGEYMSNYSWAEFTLAQLSEKKR